jgi:septal ring factor EnvC (AmiA/AmiB activator)
LETCKALTLGRVPLGSGGAGEGVAQRLARLRAEQARLSAELTALAEQSAGMDARERAELQAALQAASAAMERASQPLDQARASRTFPPRAQSLVQGRQHHANPCTGALQHGASSDVLHARRARLS